MPSSNLSNNPRFSLFLRAIGLKPGFRRTGPSSLLNIAVAAGVGVISGTYIFKQPLEEYWKEEHQRQLAQQQKGQGQQQQNAIAGTSSKVEIEQKPAQQQ